MNGRIYLPAGEVVIALLHFPGPATVSEVQKGNSASRYSATESASRSHPGKSEDDKCTSSPRPQYLQIIPNPISDTSKNNSKSPLLPW